MNERERERELEREHTHSHQWGKIEGRFSTAGVGSKLLVLDGEFALARDVTMIFISELAPIYTERTHKPQLNQNYYRKLKLPSKEKKKHSP